jgi:hypothetical protein
VEKHFFIFVDCVKEETDGRNSPRRFREVPWIVGSCEVQGGYSAGVEKVRSSGGQEPSIGITRSVVLLVDRHIGSS